MKTFFFKANFVFFLILISFSSAILADGGSDYIRIKNAYKLKHTDIIKVSDFSAADQGGFSLLQSKKIRYAKVELIYGREQKTDVVGNDWRYEVKLDVIEKNGNVIANPTLFLESGGTAKYKSSFLVELPAGVETVAFDMNNITAQDGNGSQQSNAGLFTINPADGVEWVRSILPEDIRIECSIEVEQYYFLSDSYSARPQLFFAEMTLADEEIDFDYATEDKHHIDLHWNFVFGAQEYELQFAFVDDNSVTAPTFSEIWDNSISINTTQNWYSPEIIYPRGDVFIFEFEQLVDISMASRMIILN